jgi:hypothetical protein
MAVLSSAPVLAVSLPSDSLSLDLPTFDFSDLLQTNPDQLAQQLSTQRDLRVKQSRSADSTVLSVFGAL